MAPTFPEIEPLSLSDRVINALKDAFFSGHLKPGDPIVERELARQMKVGTPVVREALIALQGQGFVRRITNTGTFVTQFTVEEVRQLYTLRIELEVLALQWARPRLTQADCAISSGWSVWSSKPERPAIDANFSNVITHFTNAAGRFPAMPIWLKRWIG